MLKSEVYSWRLSPEVKTALDLEARREGSAVATLLDQMAGEWLAARRGSAVQEDAEQRRLHAAAAGIFGSIAGANPRRAERARGAIRKRLAHRYDRRRPH